MSQEPKYTKTILCLANSRRPRGRCVAGKEVSGNKFGAWIRPVNAQNDNAISESDMQFENGIAADVLDVLTIPMVLPSPKGHQTENHLIAPDYYWTKQSRATWRQVVEATDAVSGTLWPNGDSSYHGQNDKVSEALAASLDHSLVLIEPATLALIVGPESLYGGGSRRRIRASFTFKNAHYNFVVTDPWIEAQYFAGADGDFQIGNARICVSLSEIINGSAIKLVATVIAPDRAVEE
ncbi:MAG TPA: hypothetical protein VND19_07940 [Acetobacteraceae bacterium]|nr:hypothetical protein [Acetobacteraceae bacterium]